MDEAGGEGRLRRPFSFMAALVGCARLRDPTDFGSSSAAGSRGYTLEPVFVGRVRGMAKKPREPNYTPLCEASLDALIEEIQARCVASLVVTEEAVKVDDSATECGFSYSGGFTRAIGLAERAKQKMLNDLVPGWTDRTRIKVDRGDED